MTDTSPASQSRAEASRRPPETGGESSTGERCPPPDALLFRSTGLMDAYEAIVTRARQLTESMGGSVELERVFASISCLSDAVERDLLRGVVQTVQPGPDARRTSP